MALRALSSLIAPRVWPRRIRGVQTHWESSLGNFTQAAPGLAPEMPARSLHTMMRNLAVGVYGAAASAGFAGLFAILYFSKDTEKSDVTGEATDVEGGMKKVTDREAIKEGHGNMIQEAAIKDVDDAVMKSRFQDWMKEYGRSYSSEQEKARRFKNFKVAAMRADKANTSHQRQVPFAPNGLADWSDKELERLDLDLDWKRYIELENYMTAHGGVIWAEDVIGSEAVKQRDKELAARHAEQRRKGKNSEKSLLPLTPPEK